MTQSARQIGSLTSLRFLAAMGIVIFHAKRFLLPAGFLDTLPLGAGVTFFFVLSGFILTVVHRDGIRRMDLREFYAARFARIWPSAMAALAVAVLLIPSAHLLPFITPGWNAHQFAAAFATYVTMTQAWVPIPAYYFGFGPTVWSLSTEVWFYVAFPFLLRSLDRTWRSKLWLVLGGGMAVVALVPVLQLPLALTYANSGQVTGHGIVYVNPLVEGRIFFIGMLFGLLYLSIEKFVASVLTWSVCEVMAIIGLLYSAPYLRYFRRAVILPSDGLWAGFADQTIQAVLFGAVILVFAFNTGLISRALSRRLPVTLGEISFALYLIHVPVLQWCIYHPGFVHKIPSALRFPLFLSVILLVSYVWWSRFEVPLRRRLRARLGRRAAVLDLDHELATEVVPAHSTRLLESEAQTLA